MTAIGFTGYPIGAVQIAKRLRAGGETLEQIAEFIGEEYGTKPSTRTVSTWTSKRAAATNREGNRRRVRANAMRGGRTGGRLGRPAHRPEFRLARIIALSREGLSDSAIAAVMSFDYRDQYAEADITRLLGGYVRGTWKARAQSLLKAAPDTSSAEVARRVGVSASSVQKFRAQEGL